MTETKKVSCKIAGIFNYPDGKDVLKKLVLGQAMMSQREPSNQHDPNAIAIFTNSATSPVKLGYLPRTLALGLKESDVVGVCKAVGWDEITVEFSTQ